MNFEELLKKQGYIIYTNVGYSMMPLLRQRKDIIEIRPLSARPKRYDVVFYKRYNKYVLHRVLCVLEKGYIIAGDHNTFVERDVTDDMILGVMTRVIRNGKSITPDQLFYKIYVHLWCDIYPLRMKIIRERQRIKSVLRRIKRRLKNS